MSSSSVALLVLSCLVALSRSELGGCYDSAEFCMPEPDALKGFFWISCKGYCKDCQGKADGQCVQVFNGECDGGWQCQCKGDDRPKSLNPFVQKDCALWP
ncbi:unnamed protein product [Cylicocyclus nassatus]|uniref:Uncharacterized protein n=1 Tax=Cylicocyclus nassatus TaxID=53992 RepID=A0AA36M0W4_CYLNA|nr:unnamed protein product [Cylicocyclus nassatus]